jgi:hypothetical protein
MEFLLLFVISIICAFISMSVAGSKGCDRTTWWFAGLLFGPLGLIGAAGLPDRKLRSYLHHIAKGQGWQDEIKKTTPIGGGWD